MSGLAMKQLLDNPQIYKFALTTTGKLMTAPAFRTISRRMTGFGRVEHIIRDAYYGQSMQTKLTQTDMKAFFLRLIKNLESVRMGLWIWSYA